MTAFLTTEQMMDESRKLREKLEAKQPGCTHAIPTLNSSYPTLDEMLAEEKGLKAVESGLESKSSVAARGADVAASYAKPLAQQLRDGDVTAAQISKAAEIHRIEGFLATAKPGTSTHAALTAKVSDLRAEWERLPKPTPKN